MTELIFGVIIVSLLAGFMFFIREEKRERAKLINALIAKTAQDAVNLGLTDKLAPLKPQEEKAPDMVPLDQLTEEEFDNHISQELNV